MITKLYVACMYCKRVYGLKDGMGTTGISHGICPDCADSNHPYPFLPDILQEAVNLALDRQDAFLSVLRLTCST